METVLESANCEVWKCPNCEEYNIWDYENLRVTCPICGVQVIIKTNTTNKKNIVER